MSEWQRILYRPQPFPDNYTPPSFLSLLRRNQDVRFFSHREAIRASSVITKQISAVVLFFVVFHLAVLKVITEQVLLLLTITLALFGFLLRWLRDSTFTAASFYSGVKELSLLMAAVLSLSPILMTLTKTIADDTVWATSILLLILHLYTFDYHSDLLHAPRLIAPISLNAATFAAVLLSSRLQTPLHAFGLLFFAIEIFALYPIMRTKIRHSSGQRDEDPKLAALMVLLLAPLLYVLSARLLVAFMALVGTVTFILPPLFVHCQKHKNVINGPWDEAVPDSAVDSLE